MTPYPSFRSLLRPGSRRLLIGVLLLALVGALAAILRGEARHGRHAASRFSAHAKPSGQWSHDPSPRAAALEFADTYLEFVYGRASAADVVPTSPALRARLRAGRSLTTPAELQRQVIVRGLQVTPAGATNAVAHAVVDDGSSPPYTFTFNLSLIANRWVVSAVGGPG